LAVAEKRPRGERVEAASLFSISSNSVSVYFIFFLYYS